MSNCCMDSVVFYIEKEEQRDGLEKLKSAIQTCFPTGRPYSESYLGKLFKFCNLPTEGIHIRGDVVHYDIGEDSISLDCDAAWDPMWNAYQAISSYFQVNFVMSAEEPSSNIYINTDIHGDYLCTRYKIVFYDKPDEGSLDQLYTAAKGETECYFCSPDELLQWFRDNGGPNAVSPADLMKQLDPDYITIYQYKYSY